MEYPYNSAFILDENAFLVYGGHTGSSTQAQRNAAFWLAEREMTTHLDAFLKPTIVTGSWLWNRNNNPLVLDYGYVREIKSVKMTSLNKLTYTYTASDLTNYCIVRNMREGYVDLLLAPEGWTYFPVTVEIAYESGLLTGTSIQPDNLWALTMAAQSFLNEIDSYLSNESVGDIGVQEYSNQFYHEIRTKLGHNEFGSSAVAQLIGKLVAHLRVHRALKFH